MPVEIRHSGETVTVVQERGTVTARSPSYGVDVVSGVLVGGTPYTGTYSVTPSWNVQTFATTGRTMREDFEVEGIVKLEVGNESGGLTLTI